MGLFDSYRRKVGASQPQNYASNCDITSQIVQDFYGQPGYAEVYKNNLPATPYDVIISEGDRVNKNVGYKSMLSYPYATIQFNIGDYIHWTYGDNAEIWILASLDRQLSFSVSGRIYKCNTTLKWKNSLGATIQYPATIEAFKFSSEDTIKVSERFFTGDAKRYATLQLNSDTADLKRNNRFIFDERAWKIVDIDKSHDLVQLALEEHQVNTSTDDLINEIADAYIDTTSVPSTPTTGITGDSTLPTSQIGTYSIIGAIPSDVYSFSLSNSNASIVSSDDSSVNLLGGSTVGSSVVLTAQHAVSLVTYTKTITIDSLW